MEGRERRIGDDRTAERREPMRRIEEMEREGNGYLGGRRMEADAPGRSRSGGRWGAGSARPGGSVRTKGMERYEPSDHDPMVHKLVCRPIRKHSLTTTSRHDFFSSRHVAFSTWPVPIHSPNPTAPGSLEIDRSTPIAAPPSSSPLSGGGGTNPQNGNARARSVRTGGGEGARQGKFDRMVGGTNRPEPSRHWCRCAGGSPDPRCPAT
jgi:hypothetical protein